MITSNELPTEELPYWFNRDALLELDSQLDIVRDRVGGVALGHHPGLYLHGRPGTGKSHTVIQTLKAMDARYQYCDGHLTPVGLFKLLALHRDKTIVLDDVGQLLRSELGLQLLLAALGKHADGSGRRIIRRKKFDEDVFFEFLGGIICISNLSLGSTPLLQALVSRMHVLAYDPTDEQIAALFGDIAAKGWGVGDQHLTPSECIDIATYVVEESRSCKCRLDLRTLVDKSFPDYLQWRDGHTRTNWRDLVSSAIQQQLVQLRHTQRAEPPTRDERISAECALLQQLIQRYPTRRDQIAAWEKKTGKCSRSFYRRLKVIKQSR